MTFYSAGGRTIALLVVGLAIALGANAHGALYINEIYFNPPGNNPGDDATQEYVELRFDPLSDSLTGKYLICIENEDIAAHTGGAGQIDVVWNLSGITVDPNPNGYILARQKGALGTNYSLANVAAGTTVVTNAGSGIGFGSSAASSSIGFSVQQSNGEFEGSGGTYMLVDIGAGAAPTVGEDLDLFNNGLDDPNGKAGWTILDSIGIIAENSELTYGRLYSPTINFGVGASNGNLPGGATYIDTTVSGGLQEVFEVEYIGRWGDSTGQTGDDWVVANLTNSVQSGYTAAARNYGVSGDHANGDEAEVWRGSTPEALPYGLDIPDTFGSTNHFIASPADADFDDDSDVDADDIDILADMLFRGASDPGGQDTADLDGVGGATQDDMDYMVNTVLATVFGDADLDDDVDGADFDAWRIRDSLGGGIGWATGDWDGDNDVDGADFDHWRLRLPSIGGGGVAAVPEPGTVVLMSLAVPALGLIVRRRQQ